MNLRFKTLLLSFVLAHLPLATAQNFAPPVSYATQSFPFASAAADFNGDGKLDVVVGNESSSTLSLFLGNRDGTLNQPSTIQIGLSPIVIVTGDFNLDGHVDIAVGGFSRTPNIQILFGNGDGTFQPPVDVTIPGLSGGLANLFLVTDMAVADFNVDKKPDLVVGTSNGAAILLNDGTGNFQFVGNVLDSQSIQNLAVADFNRDGVPDFALVTSLTFPPSSAPTTFVAIGNGNGSFQPPVTLPLNIQNPDGIAVADINNDGLLDVIVSDAGIGGTSNAGSVQTALQTANGTFVLGATLTALQPTGVVAGDFDGDGNVDIAVTSVGFSTQLSEFLVFPGHGDGTFAAPTLFTVGAGAAHPIAIHLTNTVALDAVTSGGFANAISVLVNHSANTLTLSSSLNPSVIGQPVTLTATVHPTFPGSGNLSGSLMLADGNTTLGTVSINSSGTGNLTTTFTSAGKHFLQAVFGGNASFVGGSSASITQVVAKANPVVSLASSPNPSTFGQTVSFTVMVSGISNAAAPTGTVNILDGGTIILSGTLDNTGKVTLATSALATGSHGITAQYSGDSNYTAASSSLLTQSVSKGSSTTTLTGTPNPSSFGQVVTFTVIVTSTGGGGTPTGTVILLDGATPVGSAALDAAGKASLDSSFFVGIHSITASYAGDGNFQPSTSAVLTETVNKSASVTGINSSPNPSSFGQAVVFTVTISPTGGRGVPTGTATLADETAPLGSAVLDSSGKASFSLSSLTPGSHSVTASYSGDTNFQPSTSPAAVQTVSRIASVTAIGGTPNPITFGQSVTLIATVTSAAGVLGTPSGTVAFSDGNAVLGAATLASNGKATLAVNSLSVGTHTISASYGGDTRFAPSSSAGTSNLSQLVNPSGTLTSLSGSPGVTVFGQAVTLTAIVAASGTGTGIPSGSVSFVDGNSSLGMAALDSTGKAVLAVDVLGVGSHSITADYAGSPNYLASVSSPLSETVTKNSVMIGLTSTPNPSTFGQSVVFTVQASPAKPGGSPGTAPPTGSVTFKDGSTVLGASNLDSSGAATLATNGLSAGANAITVSYGGDTNFSKASSSTYTQTVVPPPPGDFTISLKQASATITAGQTFSTQATLTPLNGLTGKVTLSCLGAPRGSSCTIRPASAMFSGSGPVSVSVVITTTGSANMIGYSSKSRAGGGALLTLCLLPFGFACVLTPSLKRKQAAVIVAVVFAGIFTGCGGSSSHSEPGPTTTPPGAYTITIQAVDGQLAHSTKLALTVQ